MTLAVYLFTAAALFLTVAIATVLLGYWRSHELSLRRRWWFTGVLAGIVCVSGAAVLLLALKNVRNPPEFDFLYFWINGKVAAQRLNYYHPEFAAQIAQLLQPSREFRLELLNTSFLYPPPTILFFLPLGWFSLKTAALVWYALQIGCLAFAIPLLSRVFLQDGSKLGLLVTGVLTLAMYGAYSNVKTGQTLFLLLLLVTLSFRARNRFTGGIWLGLCALLKPFAAVLLVYAIVRRKWNALAGALATLAASALLTYAIFGQAVFRSYLGQTNYAALPEAMFTEPQNQSLLAWIFRIAGSSRAALIVFVLVAVILAGVTLRQLIRLPAAADGIAFASALMLALLVYPGSLRSYSILLIVPILLLVRSGAQRRIAWAVPLAYGLMVAGGGYFIGFASALLWLVFAGGRLDGAENRIAAPESVVPTV